MDFGCNDTDLNDLEEIHEASGGEALPLLDPSPPSYLIVAKVLAQTEGSDLPGTT